MASLLCSNPSSAFLRPVEPNFVSSRNLPFPNPTLRLPVCCFRQPETDPLVAIEAFWGWLSDKGLVWAAKSPVRPGLVPEGLGLVAQRDIGRDEVVLEVPKRFWINADTVASSEIGPVCSGLKPWVSVALFLIRERQKSDSFWRPYLDILPEFTDSTIFWSDEELSEIQGSQLLNTTLGVKELVRSEFLKAEEQVVLPNQRLFPSQITMEDFFWAFGMLRSRAFTQLRGQNLVLIPLADLINHSPYITREDYAYEIKGARIFSRDLLFSLRSPVPVKANEQVLIQYDLKKSNADLALDYGFTESKEDRNGYTMTLEIPESDPFFGDKLEIAEMNGLGETMYFDIFLGQPLPPNMVPYLRLLALGGTDAFLLEGLFRNAIWGHLELPVSRANEELVCRVVCDACRNALSGYHTSIDQDEELRGGNLDPRLSIAVETRLGEKRALQYINKAFSERESELDTLEYYQERRLRELGLACDEGELIFWE